MPRTLVRRILGAGSVRFFTKNVYHIDLQDLPQLKPRIALRYRFGEQRDLQGLSDHPDYGRGSLPYLEGRLAAGDRLVIGEREGEVVLTAWIMGGHMELGEQIITTAPDHAYNYKIYTVDRHRRQGAALGLWSFLREALPALGLRRMINTVIADNTQSIKAHERAGFRPVGSFYELHAADASCYVLSKALRAFLRERARQG